ncbi:methyl-accepting chemotaxis protein [Candidatus Poribacteria bacterium]|nr:methyl-accepting chemotaxis protein [Candidatus Poribacteria bacterium]
MFKNLYQKAIARSVLFPLILVTVLGFVIYEYSRRVVLEEMEYIIDQAVEGGKTTFNAWIDSELNLLRKLASDPKVEKLLSGEARPSEVEEILSIGGNQFTALAVVDRNGTILAGIRTNEIPTNLARQIDGREGPYIVRNDLFLSASASKGVLIAKLGREVVEEFMKGFKFSRSGNIHIISEEGVVSPQGTAKPEGRFIERLKVEGKIKWDERRSPSGKKVILSGRWLPRYDLGIVSEIESDEVYSVLRRLKLGIVSSCAALLLLSILTVLPMVIRIAFPIRRLTEAAEKLAQGRIDVEVEVKGKDELAMLCKTFNGMASSIRGMISKLKEAADKVSEMSGEVLKAASQHSSNTAEQYAAINEVTATMEEIHQTSQSISEQAQGVLEVARKAVDISSSGREVVQEMIENTYSMKERIESIAQSILSLSEQTQSIAEITTSVSDIAEQSRLLAFNAAIEATKAGEYGRGFSVIASEIRSLAEQSQSATTQIKQILSDIQRAANSAVMITEEGTRGAEASIKLANRAGEVIRDLAEIIDESASSAENIANAISQQRIGIEQATSAIQHINETTKANLDKTRQIESAVQSLNELAEDLREAIDTHLTGI